MLSNRFSLTSSSFTLLSKEEKNKFYLRHENCLYFQIEWIGYTSLLMSQASWFPKLIFFSLFVSWRKVSGSCPELFVKKLFWIAKISGKQPVIESFVSAVRGLKLATFINKTFHRTCFSGNVAIFWQNQFHRMYVHGCFCFHDRRIYSNGRI